MRILFIAGFYPPFAIGGAGLIVEEISRHLRARGHETHVLASTHGIRGPGQEAGIDRVLELEADLAHYSPGSVLTYRAQLRRNLDWTRTTIRQFNPDAVIISSMWNLTRGIAWTAEQLCPGRVFYYVSDHWPCSPDIHTSYWHDSAGRAGLAAVKKILAPLALGWIRWQNRPFNLRFEHVLCVSQAIREELIRYGVSPSSLHVVHNGIDTSAFSAPPKTRSSGDSPLSILYAGNLVPDKGVHTAVEAMGILRSSGQLNGTRLAIVGSGHPEYERQLRATIRSLCLSDAVEMRGKVERDRMPGLLREFDVLVFPSRWDEPLARIIQEAMASGLVVIGTTTGGTREILVEGETGLTFPPDDAAALARRITELKADPDLFNRLSAGTRARILSQFDIRRMVDQFEEHLSEHAHAT
jgi:glycogen synthase